MTPRSQAVVLGLLGGTLAGVLVVVAWGALGGRPTASLVPAVRPGQPRAGNPLGGDSVSPRPDETHRTSVSANDLLARLDALESAVRSLAERLDPSTQRASPEGPSPPADPTSTAASMKTVLQGHLDRKLEQLAKLRVEFQSNPRHLSSAEEQFGRAIATYRAAIAALASVRTSEDLANFERAHSDAVETYRLDRQR